METFVRRRQALNQTINRMGRTEWALMLLLSLVWGEYVEAVAIMAIVLLNALLGVVQESRAESALGSLRKMAAPVARVVRDGHHLDIPAREVVPGDMVLLLSLIHISEPPRPY